MISSSLRAPASSSRSRCAVDLWQPVRRWLAAVDVRDRQRARRLAQLIPAQCPFARDVKLCGHHLFSIPPLCKLNPVYEDLMLLRFRALCFLADEGGEML